MDAYQSQGMLLVPGNQCSVLARIASTALILRLVGIMALGIISVVSTAQAQHACDLEAGGDSCGNHRADSGSAPTPASSSRSFVGNPIDVISGNKYQRADDYAAFASPLSYSRHYNTADVDSNLGLGNGWRDSYSLRLYQHENSFSLVQSDGRILVFDKPVDNTNALTGENASDGVLHASNQSLWVLPDGRTWTFSGSYPVRLQRSDGTGLTLSYQNQRLDTVTDDLGQVLRYVYAEGLRGLSRYDQAASDELPGHLRCLQLPDGSGLHFGYDIHKNLVSVRYGDGIDWFYQYEDDRFESHMTQAVQHRADVVRQSNCSTPLEQLSNTAGEYVESHISHWRFDAQGRANFWRSDTEARELSIRYDVEYRIDNSGDEIVYGNEVQDSSVAGVYRYRVDADADGQSTLIDKRLCESCEWERLITSGSLRAVSEEGDAASVYDARRQVLSRLQELGVPIQGNRFGSVQFGVSELYEQELHEQELSRAAVLLDSTNPIQMRANSGGLLDLLFGSPAPRPPGTCPLPQGMTCAELEAAMLYAEMSACTYGGVPCPQGWQVLSASDIGLRPEEFVIDGFHAVLLYHPGSNEYVVAFEGTSGLGDSDDWESNQINFFNVDYESQYDLAYDLAESVVTGIGNNNPGATLSFTGHSLGGGLASIAALATGNNATVFNSAAVSQTALYNNSVTIVGHEALIDVFNMTGDPLTNLQQNARWPAFGTEHIIGDPHDVLTFAAHGMAAVQNELQHLHDENCQGSP